MQYRRLREFALRALAAQRHGLRIEQDIAASQSTTQSRIQDKKDGQKQLDDIIQKSLATDPKWIQEVFSVKILFCDIPLSFTSSHLFKQERTSNAKQLDQRLTYGFLRTEAIYEDSNPAPKTREHPLTWRAADFTPEGVPVTLQGAAKVVTFCNRTTRKI